MTPGLTEVVVLVAVVAVILATTFALRAREGHVRHVHGSRLTSAERAAVGAPAGQTLLLEFTAPGCVPCRAARVVLEQVAGDQGEVAVITADVGDHLDLARDHHVYRAPTTLVVGPDGSVRHRVVGVPAADELAAVLDEDAAVRAA